QNQSLGAVIPFDQRIGLRTQEVLQATIFSVTGNQILAYVFLFIGIGYTVYICIKKKWENLRILVLFLVAPFVYYVIFLLFPRPAWTWYWIGLQVSYYFFLGYVFSQILRFNTLIKTAVVIVLLAWTIITIQSFHTFPVYDD